MRNVTVWAVLLLALFVFTACGSESEQRMIDNVTGVSVYESTGTGTLGAKLLGRMNDPKSEAALERIVRGAKQADGYPQSITPNVDLVAETKSGETFAYQVWFGAEEAQLMDLKRKTAYFLPKQEAARLRQLLDAVRTAPFTADEAIARVRGKRTEFPARAGEKKRETKPLGGKAGSKTDIELTTETEAVDATTYIVTLKRDWNLVIGGEPVVSRWKYRVTPTDVVLIDSQDMDASVNIIK